MLSFLSSFLHLEKVDDPSARLEEAREREEEREGEREEGERGRRERERERLPAHIWLNLAHLILPPSLLSTDRST